MEGYLAGYEFQEEKNELILYFGGCNFNCPFCNTHNINKFKEEFKTTNKKVKDIIQSYSPQKILITGGEPSLQNSFLIEILKMCKFLNIKTAIHTNGSKPEIIKKIIRNKLIDEITLDIKSPHNKLEQTTKSKTFFITTEEIVTNIKETLNQLSKNQKEIKININTLIVPTLIYSKQDILEICSYINNIDCIYNLTLFSPSNTPKRFHSINQPSQKFIQNLVEEINYKYPKIPTKINTQNNNFIITNNNKIEEDYF